jgi:rRNA maturation RNase YbeY
MKIAILNQQKQHPVSRNRILKLSQFLLAKTPPPDSETTEWGSISIVLTDHEGIRPLHAQFLNKNSTTDVITFCYDPVPGEELPNGDIIINVAQAYEEGVMRDGPCFELALYIAHGCDHLSGMDDHTEEGYQQMRTRELTWLQEASTLGLLEDLIRNE